jgi:DNA-binding CsgD family transcriptional regulator
MQSCLDEVLTTSISLLGADAGYVRFFNDDDVDPADSTFPFVAQRGFSPHYVRYFGSLTAPLDVSAREAAFNGLRVLIDDIWSHPGFEPHIEVVLSEGQRSLLATPILSRDGSRSRGVLNTYWREPRRPSREQLEDIDVYLFVAGSAIDRHRTLAEISRQRELLDALVGEQRASLMRIQERVTRMQAAAYSLEADDFRRLSQDVLDEIQHALGDVYQETGRAAPAIAEVPPFKYGMSSREMEVLACITRGMPDKQIAAAMRISRFTVALHIRHILHKMAAENRTEAGVRAEREGLLAALASVS